MSANICELAMFNLAIDSKLRACDLTRLLVQMSVKVVMLAREQWSCSGRHSAQCSSGLQNRLVKGQKREYRRAD
jgi:hypothetical protein